MHEQRYLFQLQGISPLIMHWDNIEWADAIDEERTRLKTEKQGDFRAGDDRVPPDTWKGYLYHDGQHVAMPNDNLRACLLKAAARVTLKGKKTFKELSQAAILFDEVFVAMTFDGRQIAIADCTKITGPFKDHAEAVKKLGFRLFVKRARVGQAKHIRVRPMFDKWRIEGSVTVIDDQVTERVLREIWRIAGLHIGCCDWRPGAPQSPGPYGRFSTKLVAA